MQSTQESLAPACCSSNCPTIAAPAWSTLGTPGPHPPQLQPSHQVSSCTEFPRTSWPTSAPAPAPAVQQVYPNTEYPRTPTIHAHSSSSQPDKTARHMQFTQGTLLHKATTSRPGEVAALPNSWRQTWKIKQNEGIMNMSQMKEQDYNPEETLMEHKQFTR